MVDMVRTARSWGLPPTVLLGVRKQDGTFNDRDKIIAIAVQRYEDSICGGCGLPASVTRGDDNVGRIEVHDDQICHGCEALESHRKDNTADPYPGQKLGLHVRWE